MKGIATFTVAALLTTKAAASCLCPLCILPSYRNFQAVSESMAPTLETGACFQGQTWRPAAPLPDRGQIIVFDHPIRNQEYVFRLIGHPGDRVQMRAGRLYLNGVEAPQDPVADHIRPLAQGDGFRCPQSAQTGNSCTIAQARETLPNGTSYTVWNLESDSFLDNTPEMTVPPGHVFVLGDNRDNAADSRLRADIGGPGLIPVDNIWGVVLP